ncbi:hypothetical protein DFP75_10751 [Marinomonas alcarazii]|uniref:Uncharacterized protein n=1 Tax=Marinomonas alcarazii TaxID=491949 RepID=A0A318UTP7_9GAMM|nr:hypothetical protein DFP75_10751 [Marinomonas alcarazii]
MWHPIRSCRAKATTYREKCRSCIYADTKLCGIQLGLVGLKPRPTEKSVGRAFMPTKKAMRHPIRSCRAKATTYREKCRSCIYADKKPYNTQLGLVGLKPRPTEKSVGRAFMPTKKAMRHPIRSCRAKATTYKTYPTFAHEVLLRFLGFHV